eukprot:TRINITY_DN1914_c0_g2_i1.p1 TRINITY_DN1914_c0_g2~~TRINITY_DN1914_c0_g2_i1.p1  ORF type:complete len:174 (-),score=27.31 TRINITY_DN1914_c0_g2_i1:448-969(-)
MSLQSKRVSFGEVSAIEFKPKKNLKRKTYGPGEHITFRQASGTSAWELNNLPSQNHAWLAVDRAMELRESIEGYMMMERAPQRLAEVAPINEEVDVEDAASFHDEENAAPSNEPPGNEESHLEDEGLPHPDAPEVDDSDPILQASEVKACLPSKDVQGDSATQVEGQGFDDSA